MSGLEGMEQAVLGVVIMDPQRMETAVNMGLDKRHFGSVPNSITYGAMQQMNRAGKPIDMTTLSAHLDNEKRFDAMGGLSYLMTLEALFPDPENFVAYVDGVLDSAFRRIVKVSGSKLNNIPPGCENLDMVMGHVNSVFREIQQASEGRISGITKTDDSVAQVIVDLQGEDSSTPTGFDRLDDLLYGLSPGALYVVAGRPGMGKTSFALSITRNLAQRGKKVGFFSLEMSHQELTMRLLSMESGLSFTKIRSRDVTQDDWKGIRAGAKIIAEYPLQFDDSSYLSIDSLMSKSKAMDIAAGGLDLIVVDYIHLMTPAGTYQGERHLEISQITRGMKRLARELDVPVMALSQLNRTCESRSNKRPMLADLRESGSIEQDADVVVFVYRDSAYNEKPTSGVDRVEIIVGKHRNGPTGTARLIWTANTMQFRDDPHGHLVGLAGVSEREVSFASEEDAKGS